MRNIDFPEQLPAKDPAAIIPLIGKVSDPTMVITAVTATASVYEGNDSNPANILGAISFTASQLTVLIQNGNHGVIYKIKLVVTLQGGAKFVYAVLLPVLIS